MKKIIYIIFLFIGFSFNCYASTTLDKVQKRGYLNCGISRAVLPGISIHNSDGKLEGFEIEYCKAIAALTLGDKDKVKYLHVGAKDRFKLLNEGKIDVLIKDTTATMSREINFDVLFTGLIYMDHQGLMVKTKDTDNMGSLKIDKVSVCVEKKSTGIANAKKFFHLRGGDYKLILQEKFAGSIKAFINGKCDVIVSDMMILHSIKKMLPESVSAGIIILPYKISNEPISMSVNAGDTNWFHIVNLLRNILVLSEENGVTSKNIDLLTSSDNFMVNLLWQSNNKIIKTLKLNNDAIYQVIYQVGNAREIFERTLGRVLNIDRGLNNIIKNNGVMYSLSIE
uniref:Amino acid ABC transporter substrate-binding protein n=2 Tax=Hirondellea gigas TaxID=1518452 RepID=A0A6A7FYM5_9CRUS